MQIQHSQFKPRSPAKGHLFTPPLVHSSGGGFQFPAAVAATPESTYPAHVAHAPSPQTGGATFAPKLGVSAGHASRRVLVIMRRVLRRLLARRNYRADNLPRQLFPREGATTAGQSRIQESLLAAGRLRGTDDHGANLGRPYRIDHANILSHREAVALGLKWSMA